MPSPRPSSSARPVSRFSRYALAGYVLLIVYASLYPFSGWRWQGLMPFDFVRAPLPRYITASDLFINVGGYLPLGYLVARTLPARWPRWPTWLVASLLASALSFAMESLQAFLPMRVSSNLDWLTNSLGGVLGAAVCVWLLPRLRLAGLLRLWRERWFAPHVGYGLLLLALWPVALLWPAAVLFGTGQIGPTLLQPALDTDTWRVLSAWFVNSGLRLPDFAPMSILRQTGITAAMLAASILTLASLLRPGAPRLRLALGLTLAGLFAVSLSAVLSFGPEHALAWATTPNLRSVALGLMVGLPLSYLPPRWAAASGGVSLVLALFWINVSGPGPYYAMNLQAWSQGLFIRLYGLPQWLSWLWPFAVLVYLLAHTLRRTRPHS
ncbi:VanZ family protein [Thiomonas bhubaneswarensis]|uniref:VanZ-like domain-containing protein n=1 Tax=Thiomonas bhubaneswarensis TaxID=339866 RepID=A0A0K6HXW0_9BURK|nr:VanZ family protein [Thiomonas bhubaneswarensis]CUA95661.1 VanZ like family protein (function unknown) [Thiomonas bhubaneswarensis]